MGEKPHLSFAFEPNYIQSYCGSVIRVCIRCSKIIFLKYIRSDFFAQNCFFDRFVEGKFLGKKNWEKEILNKKSLGKFVEY